MRELLHFRKVYLLLFAATVFLHSNNAKAQVVAVDDNVSTIQGKPATFNVLTNDTGNYNPGSVTIINLPVAGTIQQGLNGTITYLPNGNYIGLDEIVYQVVTIRPQRLYVSRPRFTLKLRRLLLILVQKLQGLRLSTCPSRSIIYGRLCVVLRMLLEPMHWLIL
ncbi:Ig-like domain-containing protein [Flavobacterium sp. 3HN19-14]|uniref:Ig-like domain-containing protein n=1 Tax=Flavobacterium sp. 3HN19-14 TaxID=3448133 RepID=UPI003EE00F2F